MFKKKKYLDPNRVLEEVETLEKNHKIEDLKKNPKLQRLKCNLRLVNLLRKFEPEKVIV